MEELTSFYYLGEHRQVEFVETEKVKPGVVCDVYRFTGQNAYDLAIVTVSPNCSTPLQQILEPFSTTVEGILEGYGVFFADTDGRVSRDVGTPQVREPYRKGIECNGRLEKRA